MANRLSKRYLELSALNNYGGHMTKTSRRTALITGANRGLGLELCRQLLARNYSVFATCRAPGSARELRALAAKTRSLTILKLDVTAIASIKATISAVKNKTPSLDLLINNAGILASEKTGGFDRDVPQSHLDAFRTNALGPLLVARAAATLLAKASAPKVANISSELGSIGLSKTGGTYSYRASKAALNMYTRLLAADLRPLGISVFALHPGWVKTRMGGRAAPLTAMESARSVITLIERLDQASSGEFLSAVTGRKIAW